MSKSKKYPGVYTVSGIKGTAYGIDYIHPQTGVRVRKIIRDVTSESDAFQIRSIEIADASRGALKAAYGIKVRLKTMLFEDAVKEYLEWSKGNKRSWMTDEHNSKPLKRIFGRKLMSDIDVFLVEKYKMERVEEVNRNTVNNEICLGSQVFKKAAEWKRYEGVNPFERARFKQRKEKKPASLTVEQVEAIMEKIAHPVKRDMVAFNFNTGWRIGEIRKLKWEDVDLGNCRAWIADPKNGVPVEIELNDEAADIIKRQVNRGPYVFCFKNGNPFKTNLHAVIKNAAEKAKVPLPRRKAWHIFRKTWATNFLQSGGDVETLRVLGNWKDYSMPLWYADAGSRENKRRLLNRLPKLGHGRKMAEISDHEKSSIRND